VRGLTGHPPASAPIYPLLQAQAFEPELIAVMAAVFEDILRVLKLDDRDDPLTTIIARKIIEIVRTGERDPTLIRGGVIRSFEGHGARPE
jgi:hypothetical protein